MRQILILIFFITAFTFTANAQTDTLNTKSKTDSVYRKKDSEERRFVPKASKVKVYNPDSTHSPRKAWRRSAIVPGLGQIYNGHWWKVPAIYVGLGLLANAVVVNQRDYKNFLAIAKYRQQGLPTTDPMYANTSPELIQLYKDFGDNPKFTTEAIINAKDGFYRNKEISILSFVAVWAVNVVDAYIYAKLQHSFSMDNNFGSLKIAPTTLGQGSVYASNFNATFTPALKITFTLK